MQVICIAIIALISYNANHLHMKYTLTKNRQAILACLQATPHTLTAAELHALLPTIDLTTIYRNLELFTTAGTIKKLYLTDNEATYEYQDRPHHHAVCTTCQKVLHIDIPTETFTALLSNKNFTIADVDITVRGTCTKHAKT